MKGATSSLLCRESSINDILASCNSFKTFLNVFEMIFLIVGKYTKFITEMSYSAYGSMLP